MEGEVDFIAAVNILKINQKIEIWLENKPEEHYSSRIEEIHPDQLSIAMPMSKGTPVLMPRGSNIWGKVIVNEAVYCFVSTVIDRKVQPLPIWILSMPTEVKKVQLRAFVRVVARLAVRIKPFPPQESLEQNCTPFIEQPEFQCVTKDISGGGIQIVSQIPFSTGTAVAINLALPDSSVIAAIGEVVRIQQLETDKHTFWIAIKFTDIIEKERSKLIKYIFKIQLERRQKGF